MLLRSITHLGAQTPHSATMNRTTLLSLILVMTPFFGGCGSTPDGGNLQPEAKEPVSTAREEALQLDVKKALRKIAHLEDARDAGNGMLLGLAAHPSAAVRERAAQALGRLPLDLHGAPVTEALVQLLGDRKEEVRRAAVFALGQRKDPQATDAILEHWSTPSVEMRRLLVEAAARIGTPRLREEVLFALGDASSRVRQNAASAAHRWSQDDDDAGEVNSALVEIARRTPLLRGLPRPIEGLAKAAEDNQESSEVIWRALFSLQRRKALAAEGVFLAYSSVPDLPLCRLFAVKGLARIAPQVRETVEGGAHVRAALTSALAAPDWRVVYEALTGLSAFGADASVEAIEGATQHASSHVRAAACAALGAFGEGSEEAARALAKLHDDPSMNVRAAVLQSAVRLGSPDALERVHAASRAASYVLRTGAATAAALLPENAGQKLLLTLTKDPHPMVAGRATAGLESADGSEGLARLRELAKGQDVGLRSSALGALAGAERLDLELLRKAFALSAGEELAEGRYEALRHAADMETPAAMAFVGAQLADPHPHVRRVARELLKAADMEAGEPRAQTPSEAPDEVPMAGYEFPAGGVNPMVEIVTNRGSMSFELFPREAPIHVYNFLELARRGHYDGLGFHRVVADFVVQGGCHRGDGNGSTTWRGGALRLEMSARSYVRGSLGMPRNENLDSGGSQIFVSHRPTPHLDGNYTIFGELRRGFDVLDAIEVGDTIKRVILP